MYKNPSFRPNGEVATIILAGGEGTRLQPLTSIRCKPAVSFGGRYRIIDVAISNAIHAGFQDIYVISQFLASSLNNYLLDSHLSDASLGSHIEILSPETNSDDHKVWYKGTADAVRKNLSHLLKHPASYFVILSGDQLYSMDLSDMLAFAKEKDADLTIATLPVAAHEAARMGVMRMDTNFEIIDFFEKPKDPEVLMQFAIAPHIAKKYKGENSFLGSMGIYIFKREALLRLLEEDPREDFGKHLIPTQLKKKHTYAYIFDGYWEDIGTIDSYYQANLKLTQSDAGLNLYDDKKPIYSQTITLPSPRILDTKVSEAIICDGSIIEASEVMHSMIGMCTRVGKRSKIIDSILIGWSPHSNREPTSIGNDCLIEKTIIDEGATIGNYVHLTNPGHIRHYDSPDIAIRDGIIIVKAGAHLPDRFTL